mmetsp:Transcript_28360/g.48238  ORF Transcript_28360/g.48238 Transcript_28360/m.48238 type:complete len:439 (-) Transcript_28360:1149-2465(-)
MPWLIKSTQGNKVPIEGHLFFVHVPRCGGTSLMQHFNVPQKVIDSRGVIGKAAMSYFFMRYKQLESANFPMKTKENAVCSVLLLASLLLHQYLDPLPTLFGTSVFVYLACISIFVSLFTTFIATAPVIGRITPIHRWYLWFVHYPLCRVCESIPWCTGTNKHGYIMHLTAPKLLGYGYVTPNQMDNMCSLAIVRNPYSRMVSIYGYNRFGEGESFPTFLRRWKRLMRHYMEKGEKEEWYTPCHLLPMFEYTHHDGKQIVQSVVKQEELKLLKTRDGATEAMKQDNTISDLPDLVRDALVGMPHTNSRKTGQKWWDFYDQETMELTLEMYAMDFEVFGYERTIKQRPDLIPPKKDRGVIMEMSKFDGFSRNSLRDSSGARVSQRGLFSSVRSSVRSNAESARSTLKQSVMEGNKDELLGALVGFRYFSEVTEVDEDKLE